ncbi:hypothetical protein NR402_12825 [Acidithiobacillus ferrooxidans]|uniref:phosphoribosyltransferase-like protein n=1 Tax=Acidithiobacillus ferrooxidans TaxID=920 RepID=UPI000B1B572F|nr:hypothetical protein [Acidithiobacillus ferrooxidans]MCR2831159.1 hypothetical protein [Acidithiobacillus ferrooxidans]
MSHCDDLLASIANTIQDYRDGSLPQPIPDHVERWVQQFDAAVQLPILQEIDHVLKKSYFSKEDVAKFLRGAMRTQKLIGDEPKKFWRSASFLDIQSGGSSQTDMLALFSEQLEDEHGFLINDCGQGDEVFIYLDDGIFTGNRVRRDLEEWIRDHAPAQAKVHVICIAEHSGGRYYANTKIQEVNTSSGKNVDITWWHAIVLEDRKTFSATSDVLRPTAIPNDPAVQAYVAAMQYQPTLRIAGNPGAAGLFSSDAGKILLEQEFLKAGAHIRQICPNLSAVQRPLGHMTLETLGFGSLIVTYRNCPNNAPLAFWVGDPWYPLFPRTTNTQTAVRKMFADFRGDL